MVWLGDKVMVEKKAPSVKEIFKNVDKVTLDDIKEAANITLTERNLNFSTIGPINEDKKKNLKKVLVI